MTTPHITIHDCVTGETISREMNTAELAQWETDQAQTAKDEAAKVKTDKTKASYWSCRLPRYAKLLGLKSNYSGFW